MCCAFGVKRGDGDKLEDEVEGLGFDVGGGTKDIWDGVVSVHTVSVDSEESSSRRRAPLRRGLIALIEVWKLVGGSSRAVSISSIEASLSLSFFRDSAIAMGDLSVEGESVFSMRTDRAERRSLCCSLVLSAVFEGLNVLGMVEGPKGVLGGGGAMVVHGRCGRGGLTSGVLA